jgi:nucleoside-diphosphate-sugar epimerase
VSQGNIGLLGASSLVGQHLLDQIPANQYIIYALTQQTRSHQTNTDNSHIVWQQLPFKKNKEPSIPVWLCAAPIWVLPDYFPMLEACGIKRIVCLSSTSVISKAHSDNLQEQQLSERLAHAETALQVWAANHQVQWIIIRPTLIYGDGKDKNITAISRFIRLFKCFPILETAQGLRQPVHARDVATACLVTLHNADISHRVYTLSGGETLTYAAMVTRIFETLQLPARIIPVPRWLFQCVIHCLRCFPRYRHLTIDMVERMNQHLDFSHTELNSDTGFTPSAFILTRKDLGE